MIEKHKHSNLIISLRIFQVPQWWNFGKESRLLWWQSCRWKENFGTLSFIFYSQNKYQLFNRNSWACLLQMTGKYKTRANLGRVRNLKEFGRTPSLSRVTSGPAKRRSWSRLLKITGTRYQNLMKFTVGSYDFESKKRPKTNL